MNKSKNLFTLKEFNKLHNENNMSIYEIAESYETYPNKVRRLAQKLGAKIRNKSEAQKVALSTGRQKHPTEGTTREEEVKIKISEGVAKVWDEMDNKEKKRRSDLAKEQWENMSDVQKNDLHDKAYAGIRKASQHGSKLEVQVLQKLMEWGYKVEFHRQHIIGNEKMHIDVVIPKLSTAIEIDGPSHFKPIWGEDKLNKSLETDNRKDGLLLGAGFCIIRVLQKKDLTKKLARDILLELEGVLEKIDTKFPSSGKRKFVVGA